MADADTPTPSEQPAPFVYAARIDTYEDNRAITIIERTLVEGVLPRGFARFLCQCTVGVNTGMGPQPLTVQFPVGAESLAEAFVKAPDGVEGAVMAEVERRREAAMSRSRLVLPGQPVPR